MVLVNDGQGKDLKTSLLSMMLKRAATLNANHYWLQKLSALATNQLKVFHIEHKIYIHTMAVILKDIAAPIIQVAELGYASVAVYSLLFQSAHRDRRFSTVNHGTIEVRQDEVRRDCGGTTHWSHKAIAETLKMGKATVIKATDALLDAGFIQVIGYEPSNTGSLHRVYRVTHPSHLEAQRHVLSLFQEPASVRARKKTCKQISNSDDTIEEPEFFY